MRNPYMDYSDEEAKVYCNTVGITFDERTLLHKCFNKKRNERPERLICAYSHLIASGLLHSCRSIPVTEASESSILLAHSKKHLENIKSLSCDPASMTSKLLLEGISTSRFESDTYENCFTPKSAFVSAGCVTSAIDAMFSPKSRLTTAFCITRPPGHHSGIESVGGFCFFNNVAIGARYAQRKFGVQKIAIIDWDIHHGNGTQEIFEDDPSVLLISIQRHEDGTFYPGLFSLVCE
eukprot:TRINITY_DN900_c0_g1_i1.p3 TRINITY_DN900_c0_g1~~TRINITY_DN900_c0_g1_i1.p3  ORF type:complete len:236 (-),score=0.37 TRINITY_DN900_c0_g1_i1:583-1290(-)